MQIVYDIIIHSEIRWKLFGHVLRSDRKCSTNAALDYYFEETGDKRYRDWSRTTIINTLQDDIKRTLEKMPSFSVKSLKNSVDLGRVHELF